MCSTRDTAPEAQNTATGVSLSGSGHTSDHGPRQQQTVDAHFSMQTQLEAVHAAAQKLSHLQASEQHGRTLQHAQRIHAAMQQLLHACRAWSSCMSTSEQPAPAPAPAAATEPAGSVPNGQAGNHAHINSTRQLSIIAAMQAILPCLTAPHSSLFASGEDPELQLVDATQGSTQEQLSVLGSTWLQIVSDGLLSLSLLAPAALQGVRLQQSEQQEARDSLHASGSSSLGNHEMQQGVPTGTGGNAEELLGLLQGRRAHGAQPQVISNRTVVIEVLDDSSVDVPSPPVDAMRDSAAAQAVRQAEVQHQGAELVHSLVQLFATWVPDAQLPCPYAVPSPDSNTPQQPSDAPHVGYAARNSNGNIGGDSFTPANALLQAVAATSQASMGDSTKTHRQLNNGIWTTVTQSAAARMLDPQVLAQQALLAHAAQTVLPALRRIVAAGAAGWAQSYDGKVPFTAHTGPSSQERVIAARRVAALIRQLQHPALSAAMPVALPAALAAVQDPSPAVSVHGTWALHHVATKGLAADLRVQGELVVEAARRMLVGCQDVAWQPACVASVALTVAVLGTNMRAPGYHALLSEMLTEIERHAHNSARRLAFMAPAVLHLLIQRLGLTTLRHTSRLLPLLLEWLQAYDAASRTSGANSLHVLLAHTWPRAPAHAACLWHHISALLLREAAAASLAAEREASATGQGVVRGGDEDGALGMGTGDGNKGPVMPHAWLNSEACEWALRLCDMLAACGGQPFREAVQVTAYQLDMLSPEQAGPPLQLQVHQPYQQGLQQQAAEQQQHDEAQQQTKAEQPTSTYPQASATEPKAGVKTAAKLVQHNPALRPVLQGLLRHVWSLCTQYSHTSEQSAQGTMWE